MLFGGERVGGRFEGVGEWWGNGGSKFRDVLECIVFWGVEDFVMGKKSKKVKIWG